MGASGAISTSRASVIRILTRGGTMLPLISGAVATKPLMRSTGHQSFDTVCMTSAAFSVMTCISRSGLECCCRDHA